MPRKRHPRRRHRNPTRNQWIAIGVGSAAVLTTGTILIVRHRRRAISTGGGGPQGGSGPGGRGPNWTHRSELQWLCQQPNSMTFDVQQTLINGVFIPQMNRTLAKLPSQPTIAQIDAAIADVADLIASQACQTVTTATRAQALVLSRAAWQKTQPQGTGG